MDIFDGRVRMQNAGLQGQSLNEYALITALVVIVSIPAFTLFGRNVQNQFTSMNMVKSPTISILNPPSDKTAPSDPTAPPSAVTPQAPGNTSFTNPSFKEIASSVQTAGANGATNLLANSIEQIAKQQLADGKITQNQYNQLAALANQGHRLADMEALIETAAKDPKIPNNQLFDQDVMFEGKSTTLKNLFDNIGFTQKYSAGLLSNPLESGPLASPETKVFIDLYNQAIASGALSDPAASNQVKLLASQIATISDTLVFAAQDREDSTISTSDVTQNMVSRLNSYNGSNITNENSKGICTVGNGSDADGKCSG